MMVRIGAVVACAGMLAVACALLLALGPPGSAQGPAAPPQTDPAKGPEIKYLPAIEEGHAVELTHEVIRHDVTTETWRKWAWLEGGVLKWVRVSNVATLEGEPGAVLGVEIDDGFTHTVVSGPGTANGRLVRIPSAGAGQVWLRDQPLWACDPTWLRHLYSLYPWTWGGMLTDQDWLGVSADKVGIGPAPSPGEDPWATALLLLYYEPGGASIVGMEQPGRHRVAWRGTVAAECPSTRPEAYVPEADLAALTVVDNSALSPAYCDVWAPGAVNEEPGLHEWLTSFRERATTCLQDDPSALGEFVPGLIDRPSGAVSDELQTLEWQELNTKLFVTLTDDQLEELTKSRGVILDGAPSLTGEQRELLATIWGIPEFVTDPDCERVQWCSTAFVCSEPGHLAVIRRAWGLVQLGWLANPEWADAPPP